MARRKTTDHRSTVRLLMTCIGQRVELLTAFRDAARRLGITLEVHGADSSRLAPAMHLVDRAHSVPSIATGRYIDALVRLCRHHRIDLLIPTIDTELPALASATERFRRIGCRALVSSPRVIDICRDKWATFEMLTRAGIDTPQTWLWPQLIRRKRHRFPYFMKPRAGSGGAGNFIIRNRQELNQFGTIVPDPIVQELVEGVEHTLDVYAGFDGRPRCVVPRRRLQVRSGEVTKALTVKNRAIMAVGRRTADVLGECRGVVTVQCIATRAGSIRVIEINPRFGGGVPLAIHAGADFPKWILAAHIGRTVKIRFDGFRAGVAMLRYDESVFVPDAGRWAARPGA